MASISKVFHCGIPYKKINFSSNKITQKTTALFKRHFVTNTLHREKWYMNESLQNAFVLINEEQVFSESGLLKKGEPEVMSYEEFLETIETYEEFLRYPQVMNKLEKKPHLDPLQVYENSCSLRYESHKTFFYICKILWKNTELSSHLSRETESIYPQYSALIKAMDLTGISYFPQF